MTRSTLRLQLTQFVDRTFNMTSLSNTQLVSDRQSFALGIEHTAVKQLAANQSRARFSRLLERMQSKRRLGLTILAVLLAVLWLGQAVLGVMFRETAPAGKLLLWIPLSLGAYFIWNFLKTAGQKPLEPFEWTESEREWLLSAPLPRKEAIAFRFSAIAKSALIKSLIFGFVMIPDLRIVPLGFLGILAALIFIDLIRVLLESVVWGLSKFELSLFRLLVFGSAAIIVGRALVVAIFLQPTIETTHAFGFLLQFLSAIHVQTDAWYGKALLFPFTQIASLMVAETIDLFVAVRLVAFGAVIVALSKSLVFIDSWFLNRHNELERLQLATATRTSEQVKKVASNPKNVTKPISLQGTGGLAWRQWLGAMEHRGTLAVSLLIPSLLCCLPALAGGEGASLVGNTVGSLAFYSLLLLPSALKFDFRRDVDRLTMLKALPISPFRAVAGQLLTPIAIATLFQIATLLLVMLLHPYHPTYALIGMLFLLPFNLFIFSYENLAFLWFPHRLRQEGMQVLLRSILAFTAKSLFFATTFAASYAWVLISKQLHQNLFANSTWLSTANIFAFGVMFSLISICGLTFFAVVRSYDRFDPSSDLSAID